MYLYLSRLGTAKTILWCYLFWYLTMCCFYFDSNFSLWLNSIGVSLIVGTALLLGLPLNEKKSFEWSDFWIVFRMYFTPFCVSSFSMLTKDKSFTVVISPYYSENIIAFMLCFVFIFLKLTVGKITNKTFQE